MAERGGSGRFGAVVLAGLATSGLTAVAAAQPWFRADVDPSTVIGLNAVGDEAEMPLAVAFSLVLLATWGVVLVTGTLTRRSMLVVGFLAGSGVLACAVSAPGLLPDQIAERTGVRAEAHPTAWYVVAVVSAVAALVVVVAGWRLAPRWPTMSSRYDAPAAGSAAPTTGEPDELTLWKALDEGRDPTAR